MIKSRAPTRIDLAGGTLDIWPIYLLFNGGLTLNLAIDLYTEASIKYRNDKEIHIRSEDMNEEFIFPSIESIEHNHTLGLITRGIQFFQPDEGIDIKVKSNVPPGSGLGGSSSLIISLCAALNELLNKNYSHSNLIDIAQDIETKSIKIPTGRQDYISAIYGGINSISYDLFKETITPIELSNNYKEELLRSLMLVYIESHQSSISNWDIFKKIIDRDPKSWNSMLQIKKTAEKMHKALTDESIDKFHVLLGEEWKNRLSLSEKVCTQKMREIIKIASQIDKDITFKTIGAGGGGCMLFSCLDKKELLSEELTNNGLDILPFNLDLDGLSVKK